MCETEIYLDEHYGLLYMRNDLQEKNWGVTVLSTIDATPRTYMESLFGQPTLLQSRSLFPPEITIMS